jgi:hypothetical protein
MRFISLYADGQPHNNRRWRLDATHAFCLHRRAHAAQEDGRDATTASAAPSPKGRDMDEPFIDALARAVTRDRVSRKRALQIFGGVIAVAVPSLVPQSAAASARARKRCRNKGGKYLPPGQCRCAYRCDANEVQFPCQKDQTNPNCRCLEAVDGTGFCGFGIPSQKECVSNAECGVGLTCVVIRGCIGSGASCTTTPDCDPGIFACINGTCQRTGCVGPCTP